MEIMRLPNHSLKEELKKLESLSLINPPTVVPSHDKWWIFNVFVYESIIRWSCQVQTGQDMLDLRAYPVNNDPVYVCWYVQQEPLPGGVVAKVKLFFRSASTRASFNTFHGSGAGRGSHRWECPQAGCGHLTLTASRSSR